MLRFQKNRNNSRQQGFTLVEMSIVLTLTGLVTAGIVVGQSMNHQARLTRVVSEFNGIKTALNTFQMQYDAKPGDFAGAGEYWPDGQWNTSWARSNGLGNGDNVWGSERSAFYEGVWGWQQLSRAEIIPGSYAEPEELADNFTFVRPVQNLYPSRFSQNAGYMLLGAEDWMGEEGIRDAIGNYVLLGDFASAESWDNANVLLSAEDSMILDSKMDDGLAMSGEFLSEGDCLTGGEYDIAAKGGCVGLLSLDRNFKTDGMTLAMNDVPPAITDATPDDELGNAAPSAGTPDTGAPQETPAPVELAQNDPDPVTDMEEETPQPGNIGSDKPKEGHKCQPKPKPKPKPRKGGLCNHGRG